MEAVEIPIFEALTTVDVVPALTATCSSAIWLDVNQQLLRRAADVLGSGERPDASDRGGPLNLWMLRRLERDLDDATAVARAALQVGARADDPPTTESVPLSDGEEPWLIDQMAVVTRELDSAGLDLRVAAVAPTDGAREAWLGGQRLLRTVWPMASVEVDTLISVGVLLDGPNFSSGSAASTFGAVYVSPATLADDISAIEVLVHEVAHHVLWMREAFQPFVENPETRVSSPLRGDERPMEGVFHAAFVLARICACLLHVLADDASCDRYGEANLAALVDDRAEQLRAALETIRATASLTDEGRALVANMERLAGSSPG